MKITIKKCLVSMLSLTMIVATSIGIVGQSTAYASVSSNAQTACNALNEASGNSCDTAGDGIAVLLRKIIRLLQIIVGVLSLIMVIIAAMKYTLSQGDNNAINSAKNTIIYSIVGLIIVVFAETIVQFVLNRIIEN